MFEIPSDENISGCLVTKEVIDGTGTPVYTYRDGTESEKNRSRSENIEETA